MERWIGRTVIVTGASAGIGASIAEELTKAGMTVIALARRLERLQEAAKKLTGAKGKYYPLRCDITKEEDILAVFKFAKEKCGGVDVLINNAGITRVASLLDGETSKWKEIIDTNLTGLLICTREAIKSMRERGVDDGHIIHIASVAGHYVPNINGMCASVYSATKHGVLALTDGLRMELRDAKTNIKVTTISPGYVDTEIIAASVGNNLELLDKFPATAPSLKSVDVANAVIYALGTPPYCQIHEIVMRPLGEMF